MTSDLISHWIQAHLPQIGGTVGMLGSVIFASALSDNALLVGAILGILVALSTLMIRIFSVIDSRVRAAIAAMQANGDLPTRLERDETRRTLEVLDEKADRNVAELREIHAILKEREE